MNAVGGQPIEEILKELLKRLHVSPNVPPSGFDPVRAHPNELAAFGFPPRPDPDLHPAEFRLWTNVFVAAESFQRPSFSITLSNMPATGGARAAAIRTRHQGSGNWSGGYIKPRDGRMFTWLYGSWTVPAVVPPAGAAAGDELRSSTWIGLDGQRRYLHSSLPQVGTAQTAIAGQPPQAPTAWCQWWARGMITPIITLPLVVNVNDVVRCLIIVKNDVQVVIAMFNVTTNTLLQPFEFDSPSHPSGVPLRVSGATAEWVMERPTKYLTGNLWKLPAYDTVQFVDCLAVSEKAPLTLTGRLENVVGARPIDMFDVRTNPTRAVVISRAARTGRRTITTRYVP